MIKNIFTLAVATLMAMTVGAQTATKAKSILDKTAAIISNKSGASASFKISGSKTGTMSGRIFIKGNKFKATTPEASMWFNGTTQWTYMNNTEEVNISSPTEGQQMQMNPYKFITLYKTGYALSSKTLKGAYEVHLKATDAKRPIKEMIITINSKTYLPSVVRMLQNGSWTTVNISNFKKENLSDATFTFDPKQYPDAEIIDLR